VVAFICSRRKQSKYLSVCLFFQLFRNLQRVEEELQSSGGVAVAPPVPPRASPLTLRGDAGAADAEYVAAAETEDDDYLELRGDEDVYESDDVVPPMDERRRRRVLPGQASMPESSLPPAVMPRKQSCPDAAIAGQPRPPKPFPQTPEESRRPAVETVSRKPVVRPPVADRRPPKPL